MAHRKKLVSVVVPCYNEEPVIRAFHDRVSSVAADLSGYAFEFLFVDDGSQDGTAKELARLAENDDCVKVLSLSRNFGHQHAITAGLDYCTGDYVVVLDADLQDPPEHISEILDALEKGNDLVHMVRSDRASDSVSKRVTARLFYFLMRRFVMPELPQDAGDYKGFNRPVLHAIGQYRERVRFLRGLFASLGFRQIEIPYVRDSRYGGASKYPWRKVLRFATDAVFSFSPLPLRLCLLAGLATWLLLFGFLGAAALRSWVFGVETNGMVVLLVALGVGFSGLVLVALGIVGEYLSRILLELKDRPLYHVSSTVNFADRAVPLTPFRAVLDSRHDEGHEADTP